VFRESNWSIEMKNRVSIRLNGDVTLSDFAKVMNHLTALINYLTIEIEEEAKINIDLPKHDFKVIGLPFYNIGNKHVFEKAFSEKLLIDNRND
jgi:hypothetical protein